MEQEASSVAHQHSFSLVVRLVLRRASLRACEREDHDMFWLVLERVPFRARTCLT